MRDYQRSKLYEAENCAYTVERELTLDECESFVKRVLRSRWTQRVFPLARKHSERVRVLAPLGNLSWTDPEQSIIYLALWTRSKFFALHEVGHLLTPARYPFHGKEFAGVFLKLIKYWLGPRAYQRLKNSFDKRDVDYKEVA